MCLVLYASPSLEDFEMVLTSEQVNIVLPRLRLGHAFRKHLAESPRPSGSFGFTTNEPSRELLIVASCD